MLRELINNKEKESEFGFRYRGLEATRLENLTDAVFGFAITLLVIASQVPKTYVELQASMYDFVGFIFCFVLLFGIWNNHNSFFKHYGMQDKTTKSLNFLFLFVLLFYIYPLKYLFSFIGSAMLINFLLAQGFSSEALEMAKAKTSMANMDVNQWEDLLIRFGLGLFFIYAIFASMHLNALKKRESLNLNELEIFETKSFIMAYLFLIVIASLSMLIVMLFGGRYAAHAGFVYLLIPIFLPLMRHYRVKKLKRIYLDPVVIEEEVIE